MRFKIEFYGELYEIVGTRNIEVEEKEGIYLKDVIKIMHKKYPDLEKKTFKTAVNHEFLIDGEIKDGDLIVMMPMFSGG